MIRTASFQHLMTKRLQPALLAILMFSPLPLAHGQESAGGKQSSPVPNQINWNGKNAAVDVQVERPANGQSSQAERVIETPLNGPAPAARPLPAVVQDRPVAQQPVIEAVIGQPALPTVQNRAAGEVDAQEVQPQIALPFPTQSVNEPALNQPSTQAVVVEEPALVAPARENSLPALPAVQVREPKSQFAPPVEIVPGQVGEGTSAIVEDATGKFVAQGEPIGPGTKVADNVNMLDLQACIDLGVQHQPALAAANASLAAAYASKRGLDRIRFGVLFSPDLPVRRQQACLGIEIAQAALFQAEWETRYAITRNYYSVLYARKQEKVAGEVVRKLDGAVDKAKLLVKAGDPNIKVTQIDVDTLTINREFYRARYAEAKRGIQKAMAALREAMGIPMEMAFDVAPGTLPEPVAGLELDNMVSTAIARRGEMAQASSASQVTELEIQAQQRIRFSPTARTFAAGADIHAKPIPQGVANGEYRPGAIGLEMPVNMAGPRSERVARARDLSARAYAVVDKTQKLIALEVAAAYLKWAEAADQIDVLKDTPAIADKIAINVQGRFDNGSVGGEDLIRAQTLVDQAQANYNQALYVHALALAALERVTAGGYRVPTSR